MGVDELRLQKVTVALPITRVWAAGAVSNMNRPQLANIEPTARWDTLQCRVQYQHG